MEEQSLSLPLCFCPRQRFWLSLSDCLSCDFPDEIWQPSSFSELFYEEVLDFSSAKSSFIFLGEMTFLF